MNKTFSYHMPTKIVFGINELENVAKYINGRKTLLIASQGFAKRGLVDKIKSVCNSIIDVFTDVKSHPEFKDLELAYETIHKNEFDLILAIGGGSVLDAAKYFSVYTETKSSTFVTAIIKGKVEKKDYKTIPIIAVPTTAGTGSELTPWATIWDMDEKKKYSLHLPELFSEIALYDPSLTLSVPKDITIQTGLDTLSHALESIWNKNANEITINYAIQSAKLIMEYLPKLADDLENLTYRTQILKACMNAGLAFSNTQTAIAHAMSYYITAHKGTPHGIACSFTLPMLIDKIIGQYDFIDEALLEIFGECSSSKLRELLLKLNVSTQFNDYGIDKNELEKLESSLNNNQRAENSLVSLDEHIHKVPIAVFFFRRKHVIEVFKQVRLYKPSKLYLVSDGGRTNDEHQKCINIRNIIDSMIDWDCDVIRIYKESNLGVDIIIPQTITEIFKIEDQLIILEDDCVPKLSFFDYCSNILERYRDDYRIMSISGTNWFHDIITENNSYFFSIHPESFGWATWKRAWKLYDHEMKLFEVTKSNERISNSIPKKYVKQYIELFKDHKYKILTQDWKNSHWDGKWLYSFFHHGGLSIVPSKNLITNIGFDSEATHTTNNDHFMANRASDEILFPLTENKVIMANKNYDSLYAKKILGFTFFNKIKLMIKTILGKRK